MNFTNKLLVETYTGLFEGLSETNKVELIESLSKSLNHDKSKKNSDFYNSFGAFGSTKLPKNIISEIKENRKFRNKNISL